jgi:hypothetical protein
MKSSDSLFRLVKAMNKSEKRYFTVMSKTHRQDNDATLLFGLLDKMEAYDEESLRKKLKNNPVAKRLDVAKVQLYNTLVKYLRMYHESQTAENKILEFQLDANILFEKGLLEEALKRIRKAKALCYEFEKFGFLSSIIAREYEIVLTTGAAENMIDTVMDFEAENKSAFALTENAVFYSIWANKLIATDRVTSPDRQAEIRTEFESLMKTPAFADTEKALSVRAKRLQTYCLSTWYHFKNDAAGALPYYKRQIEIQESHPHLIPENALAYISAMYSCLICYYSLYRFEDAAALIDRMKAFPNELPARIRKSENLQARILMRIANIELGIHLRKGSFDPSLLNKKEIDLVLAANTTPTDIARNNEIILNYAILLYGCGEHKKSLSELRRLQFNSALKMRDHVALQVHLLFLIIHFDKQNEKFDYLIKQTEKEMQAAGLINVTVRSVLDWMADKTNLHSNKQTRITGWKNFKNNLLTQLDPNGDGYNIDFLAWADSHITGKTYAACVKLRYEQIKEQLGV